MTHGSSNTTNRGSRVPEGMDGFFFLLRERPVLVGGVWGLVFAMLIVCSYATGIMPTIERDAAAASVTAADEVPTVPETTNAARESDGTPVRIVIDAIGVDAPIMHPTSRDIDTLDQALMEGVVHYPGSGDLSGAGNMFLLGHSTGFRVVQNDAYRVFNDLKHLKENDVIRVRSGGEEHLYRVRDVSLVNATEASVDLRSDEKLLTLATCNVFGAKEERYVVTAEFVGSYPIADEELDV